MCNYSRVRARKLSLHIDSDTREAMEAIDLQPTQRDIHRVVNLVNKLYISRFTEIWV